MIKYQTQVVKNGYNTEVIQIGSQNCAQINKYKNTINYILYKNKQTEIKIIKIKEDSQWTKQK